MVVTSQMAGVEQGKPEKHQLVVLHAVQKGVPSDRTIKGHGGEEADKVQILLDHVMHRNVDFPLAHFFLIDISTVSITSFYLLKIFLKSISSCLSCFHNSIHFLCNLLYCESLLPDYVVLTQKLKLSRAGI